MASVLNVVSDGWGAGKLKDKLDRETPGSRIRQHRFV
jgi:hypothetical protein